MTAQTLTAGVPRRLAYIDSLRGLAALYVVVFHTVLVPAPNLPVPSWLRPVVINGGSGVTLFFVLTAFTMCYTLRGRAANERTAVQFYLRRFFRIAPLYYVVMAATLAIFAWQGMIMPKLPRLFVCVTFVFNLIPGVQEGIVAASWTLGVEMLFYLLFPVIARYVTSVAGATVFVGISFAAAALNDTAFRAALPHHANLDQIVHMSVLHQMPVFALGILAHFLHLAIGSGGRRAKSLSWLLLLGGIAGWVIMPALVPTAPRARLYLNAVIYTSILLGLSVHPVPVIVNRLTVFFGAISYSVYLIHPQVIMALSRRLFLYLDDAVGNQPLRSAACVLTTLAVVTPLSVVTYYAIEQPAIRYGSGLLRRLRPGPLSRDLMTSVRAAAQTPP